MSVLKAVMVILVAGAVLVAGMVTEGFLLPDAYAVVGRPGTAGSVAGVARRTSRRMIRRTSVYVATLPAGCQTVQVEGTTLNQCGGTYYQADGSQYVVVEVD